VVDNNSASDDIISLCKQVFIFRTNTENESISLMNNTNAYNLHGFGDAYILSENSKTRFQTCFVSHDEVEYFNQVICTFYELLDKKNNK